MNNDTIVAISTPHGVGGVAVVRLSGPQAKEMALRHLSVDALEPRHSHFARFSDGNTLLDEVLAVWFPAPHSYTGEDVVEISCHGSLYVQQAILQALMGAGARMADPGEFTMRAYLGGRLNLSQAEAVADLIEAVTPVQHRLAVSQLRGGYAEELKTLRQQLIDLTALLELELDFSQEDVEFANRSRLEQLVEDTSLKITSLRNTFHQGNALKHGIPTAIIGRPNAGKSSLLNALLADDRAIVSPIPGTTRDTVEETLTIDGITLRLIDTAGLHHTDNPLEKMGIRRTEAAAVQADIILFVHDATCPWNEAIEDLQELQDAGVDLNSKHLWIVHNKVDLLDGIPQWMESGIAVSSVKGTGLDRLRACMVEALAKERPLTDEPLLTNLRHYEALGLTNKALFEVMRGLKNGTPADLLAVDLRDALYHLGTITGEVTNDEVLSNIFSRFCIGK
jgi:tRNA modification GTPase